MEQLETSTVASRLYLTQVCERWWNYLDQLEHQSDLYKKTNKLHRFSLLLKDMADRVHHHTPRSSSRHWDQLERLLGYLHMRLNEITFRGTSAAERREWILSLCRSSRMELQAIYESNTQELLMRDDVDPQLMTALLEPLPGS